MKTPSAAVAAILLLASCTSQQQSPSVSSSASGSAQASASAVAEASAPMRFEDVEPGSSLPAGTYVMSYATIGGRTTYPTLSFEFTVPDGWERVAIDGLLSGDNGAQVGFAVVDNVFADPCDPDRGFVKPAVGPTVDELARAIENVPGYEREWDWDVYSGFGGIHLVLTAHDESCGEEFRLLRAPGFPGFVEFMGGPVQVDLWILSVQGTRVVIYAIRPPDAPAAVEAEIQAVFDSIHITP
jgi:hypothetical protein